MRILSGVVGEGMGLAIRSRVVLERLAARHEVHVVVSGRAHDYLSDHLAAAARGGDGRASVHRIWGLSIVHAGGAAAPAATALQNLKGALTGLPRNVAKYFEIAAEFDSVHTVERALEVGSLDSIVAPEQMRTHLIGALERALR